MHQLDPLRLAYAPDGLGMVNIYPRENLLATEESEMVAVF
jgi:hypothetical protein